MFIGKEGLMLKFVFHADYKLEKTNKAKNKKEVFVQVGGNLETSTIKSSSSDYSTDLVLAVERKRETPQHRKQLLSPSYFSTCAYICMTI